MKQALLAAVATIGSMLALGAGTAAGATDADVFCASPFSLAASLQPYATGRSVPTSRTEKPTEHFTGAIESTPGKSVRPTGGTIDVYFHVIRRNDGTGSLTQQTVDAQVNVLNLSFGGVYGGANTGFGFRLAGVDTTTNNAWFALETFEDELAMKTSLKRGDADDLNIYSMSGGGYLGWTYNPRITTSRQYGVLDGVVIHYGSVPGGHIARFNLGFTATHEVGHWLGLVHTFEKGCLGWGDYVDDTPYMSEPTEGCPAGKDTCARGSGTDPIHNFMDYSDDACYTQFTAGQAERAQKQFAHWRLKRT